MLTLAHKLALALAFTLALAHKPALALALALTPPLALTPTLTRYAGGTSKLVEYVSVKFEAATQEFASILKVP